MNGYFVILGFELLLLAFCIALGSLFFAFWLKKKNKFSLWRMVFFGLISTAIIVFTSQVISLSGYESLLLDHDYLVDDGEVTSEGYIFAIEWSLLFSLFGIIVAWLIWLVLKILGGKGLDANRT